jgi:hypothetical protein
VLRAGAEDAVHPNRISAVRVIGVVNVLVTVIPANIGA